MNDVLGSMYEPVGGSCCHVAAPKPVEAMPIAWVGPSEGCRPVGLLWWQAPLRTRPGCAMAPGVAMEAGESCREMGVPYT